MKVKSKNVSLIIVIGKKRFWVKRDRTTGRHQVFQAHRQKWIFVDSVLNWSEVERLLLKSVTIREIRVADCVTPYTAMTMVTE